MNLRGLRLALFAFGLCAPVLGHATELRGAQTESALLSNCAQAAAAWFQGKPGIEFEEIDADVAIPLCEEAVDAHPDNGDAWAYLARALSRDNDEIRSLNAIRKSVEYQSPAGYWSMGIAHEFGYGLDGYRKYDSLECETDYTSSRFFCNNIESVRWYRLAAESGDPLAEVALGRLYLEGKGLEPDEDQAEIWLQRSAHQGLPSAQIQLRRLYLQRWDFDAALDASESAIRSAVQIYGESNYRIAGYLEDHGDLLLETLSKPLEAVVAYERAVLIEAKHSVGSPDHLVLLLKSSDAAHEGGDTDLAKRFISDALTAYDGPSIPWINWTKDDRGGVYIEDRANALMYRPGKHTIRKVKATTKLDVEPNVENLFKDPPQELFSAVESGDVKLVRRTLRSGAAATQGDEDGRGAFHYLAKIRNSSLNDVFKITKLLLKYGADPTKLSLEGDSPLDEARNNAAACAAISEAISSTTEKQKSIELLSTHLDKALKQKHYQCAEVLLVQGARLEYGLDADALHTRASVLDDRALRLLLRHGLDPNLASSGPIISGTTLLERVIGRAKAGKFNALLRHGADPSSALIHLAKKGFLSPMKKLLEAGADPNFLYRGRNLLDEALRAGRMEVVNLLLQAGADTDGSTRSRLIFRATYNSNLEMVSTLLGAGVNPNISDRSGCALTYAIKGPSRINWDESEGQPDRLLSGDIQNRLAIVKLLLNAGADPSNASCGNLQTIAAEVEQGFGVTLGSGKDLITQTLAELNIPGWCTFGDAEDEPFLSVKAGDPEKLREWLAAGNNPNVCDKSGTSILFYAAKNGVDNFLRLLLDAGGNANTRDSKGRSLLHEAALSGHEDSMAVLVKMGAILDHPDLRGQTPLFDAVISDDLSAVRFLLSRGAAVDGNPNAPSTPLGRAAQSGWVAGVSTLLEFGANPDGIDIENERMRPIDQAAATLCPECIKALLEAGADATARNDDTSSPARLAAYCDPKKPNTDLEPALNLLLAASPNEDLGMVLKSSVSGGCLDGVELLLKKIPETNRLSDELLHKALSLHPNINGKADIAHDSSADLAEGAAAARGIINLLLNRGANANAIDSYGRSVLTRAAITQDVKLIRSIVEFGADHRLLNDKKEDTWAQLDYEPDGKAALTKVLGDAGESNSVCLGSALIDPSTLKGSAPTLVGSPGNLTGNSLFPVGLAIYNGGRMAITERGGNHYLVWDLENVRVVAGFVRDGRNSTHADLAGNGGVIALSTELGLRLVSLPEGRRLFELDPSHGTLAPPGGGSWLALEYPGSRKAHEVDSVALSPNGERALLQRGYWLEAWDLAACARLGAWQAPDFITSPVWRVDGSGAFVGLKHSDGEYLVELEVTDSVREVRRWRLPDPEQGKERIIKSIVVSPLGDHLLIELEPYGKGPRGTQLEDVVIVVFDIGAWRQTAQWQLPIEYINDPNALFPVSIAPFISSDGSSLIGLFESAGCFHVIDMEGTVIKPRQCMPGSGSLSDSTQSISSSGTGLVVTGGSFVWHVDFRTGSITEVIGGEQADLFASSGLKRVEISPDLKNAIWMDHKNIVQLSPVSAPSERITLGGLSGCEAGFASNNVVSGSCSGNEIRYFDAKSGEAVLRPDQFSEVTSLSPFFDYTSSLGSDGRDREAIIGGTRLRLTTKGSTLTEGQDGVQLMLRSHADNAGDSLGVWDVDTLDLLFSIPDFDARFSSAVPILSRDGKWAITATIDGLVNLFDIASGDRKLVVDFFDGGGWVTYDDEGRFDTSNFQLLNGLSWVVPQEPSRALPIEAFLKEYYEPGLLGKVLQNEPLRKVTSVSELNRTLPSAEVVSVEPDASGTVRVNVRVQHGSREVQRDGGKTELLHTQRVLDLKLFRDGQLVGSADGDLLPRWEHASTEPENGSKIFEFQGVKLPSHGDADKVEFEAYVFNESGIKSTTASFAYTVPEDLPERPRRAYVVSLGMNAYENSSWDLAYAADDACAVQAVLLSRLRQSGAYSEVIGVPLISLGEGQTASACEDAGIQSDQKVTKARVRAVFEALAGRPGALLASVPNGERLLEANPEDVLIISYSGHGLTDSEGGFHLFPWDIGAGNKRAVNDEFYSSRSISSDDLSEWLRDVDAGEITMVVDACQSAASIEGAGNFRPGPMGSRGLGQFAYDKGMRLLAASQAESVALESDALSHGMLTYSLVREGLGADLADHEPVDGTIGLTEWLAYGVSRVPALYEEIFDGTFKTNTISVGKERGSFRVTRDDSDDSTVFLQQPTLFDFARRDGLQLPSRAQ